MKSIVIDVTHHDTMCLFLDTGHGIEVLVHDRVTDKGGEGCSQICCGSIELRDSVW